MKMTRSTHVVLITAVVACLAACSTSDEENYPDPPPEIEMRGKWRVDIKGSGSAFSFVFEVESMDAEGWLVAEHDFYDIDGQLRWDPLGNPVLDLSIKYGDPVTCYTIFGSFNYNYYTEYSPVLAVRSPDEFYLDEHYYRSGCKFNPVSIRVIRS